MGSILSMIGLLAMAATILPLLASAGPAVAVGVASVAATIVGRQVQHDSLLNQNLSLCPNRRRFLVFSDPNRRHGVARTYIWV